MAKVAATRGWALLVLALLCSGFPARWVLAQDPSEADPAALDVLYEQGHAAARSGHYTTAEESFRELLELAPDDAEARQSLAAVLIAVGKYEEAEAELRRTVEIADRLPKDEIAPESELRTVRHELADLLRLRGRNEEARAITAAILEDRPGDYRALALQGFLHLDRGRRDEAQKIFLDLAARTRRQPTRDFEDLLALGQSLMAVRGYTNSAQLAKDALDEAKEIRPLSERLAVERGRLYLAKYQSGDAINYELRPVLSRNENLVEARVALVDAYIYRFEYYRGKEEVETALATNPHHPRALLQRAFFAVDDYDFPEAQRLAREALEVNPWSTEALSVLAATQYLLEDRESFEATCKQVLEIDPTYGELYHITANLVALLRRYEEARTLCQKAVEIDPLNWLALTSLGRYCLNTGHDEVAIKHLEKAQENDPFRYAWRLNMLEVARFFRQFVAIDNERFRLKLHVDESPVMRSYLTALLEQAYASLTRKYGFEPENPTVVEMFPSQADFAVRTIGFEGIQGVLGACFGRVMTLNSPRALPPGSFVWARTAWHEFAHVITLQLSNYRVPRWLTEGLSVYEEGEAHRTWARDQDYDLFNAYKNGKIFPIHELNGAFRSPAIVMAYYQSGLLCSYLAETYGFEKLVDMLKAYGKGLSTEEVFTTVFERKTEEIDAEFLAHISRIVGRIRAEPLRDRDTLDKLRFRVKADPEDFDATIELAAAYLQHGKSIDFGQYFARASRLRPEDPRVAYWEAEDKFRKGRLEEAKKGFLLAERGGMDEFFLHQRLAVVASETGDIDEAIARYGLAKQAFPGYVGPRDPYTERARLMAKKGETDGAMGELRAYVAIVQEDFPNRVSLARYDKTGGNFESAAALLAEAIQINPFDREVHLLLGETLVELERLDQAIRELEVARELSDSPESRIEVQRRLVTVYLAANRPEDARFELQEILRIAKDDEEALRMLEKIGE